MVEQDIFWTLTRMDWAKVYDLIKAIYLSKASGKPQESPPCEIFKGGVGKTKKNNFRTSEGQGENSAGSCPANLGGELEKESETGPAEELSNF